MEEKNPNYPCKLEMKMTKATTTKAPKEQLNCPRCKSNNTKFCYYNNYSLNQPRYFCKSCRRYWTEGGSLRNVPIGGASRKNRSKASSSTTTSTSSSSDYFCSNNNKNKKLPNYPSSSQISTQIPVGLRDLNLADHDHLPKVENVNNYNNFAFGFRGLSSFIPNLMPDSNNINNNGNLGINSSHYSQYSSSGFSLGDHVDEFKPSFGINSVDRRNLLLPFQELNQQSAAPNEGDDHQNWSGMLGGGSL
ncbi:hypothetical protein IC582_027229 [Cucumis melo]|uniref:Dof zinc finger protein n=3 Tax=Cucumis melo TaxID=3656 RepID=A0A1S3CC55_CUCME|nr:dof zinc finger protein DOF3.7 [Cucumis melo]XP_008459767.1 dof zinc finger protein DOF3.7 [Cucumis melo]ADN34229.1 f-box family protein [Cucumis melo subsp. melo]